jgi:tRNA1(Val) A37 N6-methylase TrmN6
MTTTSLNEFKYSDISYKLTKTLSKDVKKNNGIFFTPPETIQHNLNIIDEYTSITNPIKNILEPSCGSCEFITALSTKYPESKITGIEYNKTIYDTVRNIYNSHKYINILNEDFTKHITENKYDLIIGNPPYIVIKKQQVSKEYNKYFDGRPNMFIIFIIKSLNMLNKNGILSFILPKNFLNCLYYDKTREYIYKNYTILDIIECNDKYIETQQDTIILIIKNIKPSMQSHYVLNINKYTIFGTKENIKVINELIKDSVSLHSLNFKVSVGNIVWNQNKDILTDDTSKTRLIYSSDIKNNELVSVKYNNKEKKCYINKKGNTKPILVINRGYGVGNYNFEYCLINKTNQDIEYLIENHLICINYNHDIDIKDLILLYNKIITSLEDKRTHKFIDIFFGNNAINTTELNYILPIYN